MPLIFRLIIVATVSLAAYGGDEPTAVVGQAHYSTIACAAPAPCGDISDVHYPFFLADSFTTDGTAYSYCGYPGMEVTCEGGRATMLLKSVSYTVLDINYGKHTVTVVDTDVLSGGECPRVTRNVTVPAETTWLDLSATDDNDNLAFFFDCVFATGTPTPVGIRPINCSSFPQRDGVSYVARKTDVRPQDEWPRACKEVVVVPVLTKVLSSDEYLPRLNSGGYGQVLKQGFQLSWDPSRGPCYLCKQSGGQCSYNQSTEVLRCLCSDDGRVLDQEGRECGFPKEKVTPDIITIVLSAILLPLVLLVCALCYKKSRGVMSPKGGLECVPRIESFLQKHEAQHPKRYSYSQVKRMTKSFTHKLGQGGFGTVYKGNLPIGREVAVKLLKISKDDGQEFMNEVVSIMRTSHVNVVALLGYCLQGSKRALIYEYMPNGSLERFAFGQGYEGENSLSWDKLFDITVGIARGLEYLHRGCSTRIVHFDIKPHNILLDQNLCPKISDFGLAKLCMKKESIISIDGARGTIGYIAPEVFSQQFGQVSSKLDVYSYGMMVLEMVGARKNINKSSETSSKYFPQWVYEHLKKYCDNACDIGVDNKLVRKMIVVGLWCIQLQPNNRPSMTRVVEMLESRENDLQIPPQSILC